MYVCPDSNVLLRDGYLASLESLACDHRRHIAICGGVLGPGPPRGSASTNVAMPGWGQGTNGRQIMQIPVTIVPPEVFFLTRAFVGGAVCRMPIFCAYYLVGSGRHAPASSWISLPGASWCLGGSARGSGSFLATIPGALVGPLVITSWPLQAPCHQHHRTRSVESALLNPYH